MPAAFFELQTQEKKCVGGSRACPQRFSGFRRKKRSVFGVRGSARGVFRASDPRKRACWGFSGVPAAFLGRTIHLEQLLARKIQRSPGSGASPTCPGLSGAASENGDPRGQLQQMRACFGLVGAKISLFYFSQRTNHFILVRQLPGFPTKLSIHGRHSH